MEKSLDYQWKLYISTGNGYEELVRAMTLYVYRFPLLYSSCSEEDCGDFLLSFYSRIPQIILRYTDQGKGIEAYLKTCLKWQMKTYFKTKKRERRNQYIALREYYTTEPLREEGEPPPILEEIHETHPFFCALKQEKDPVSQRKKSRATKSIYTSRKLLLLSIKAAYDMGDEIIESVAQATGIHRDALFHLVEIIRTTLHTKQERCRVLQDKRSRILFRICSLMDEIQTSTSDTVKEKLKNRLSREKKSYQLVNKRLRTMHLTPSHQQIAEMLGIPKGSIDSTLYYLKKGGEISIF